LTEPKRSDSCLETSLEPLFHDRAHTPVNNDPMESSEADQEEIEEETPRPKGANKREELHEDEANINSDEESEFKTPRTLRKGRSTGRKAFVVYSESEVDNSEVEAQQEDKGNNSECEKEQAISVNATQKVRTYNYTLATGGGGCLV
jgi:hypothetical protein